MNRELSTGKVYTPDNLRPDVAPPPESAPGSATKMPPRSVVALTRDNWETTTITVPNDRAEHQPIYTRSLFEDTGPARNRGQFPTAQSANELMARNSSDKQLLEAAEAPFGAMADIVLFVPRALFLRPWQTTRTGTEPYRRAPNPRGSLSPVVATHVEPKDPGAAPVQVPIGELPPLDKP